MKELLEVMTIVLPAIFIGALVFTFLAVPIINFIESEIEYYKWKRSKR